MKIRGARGSTWGLKIEVNVDVRLLLICTLILACRCFFAALHWHWRGCLVSYKYIVGLLEWEYCEVGNTAKYVWRQQFSFRDLQYVANANYGTPACLALMSTAASACLLFGRMLSAMYCSCVGPTDSIATVVWFIVINVGTLDQSQVQGALREEGLDWYFVPVESPYFPP